MIDSEVAPPQEAVQQGAPVSEAPPKLNPDSLALRGRPPGALRFRREAIMIGAAVVCMSVAGVGWFALRPTLSSMAARDAGEDGSLAARPNGEQLANAPKSYGDVPKLGPPLPGDLGKPILDHQREAATAVTPTAPGADQAPASDRQHQEEAARAARESGVMVQIAGGERADQTAFSAASGSALTAARVDGEQGAKSGRMALDPEHDPGQQQRKADFIAATEGKGDVNPHALTPPTSPYTLSAGTIIAASLITGLNSDLPGLVSAQVIQNVYDTATGRYLLLPQGSRLIGSYDSVVAYGQSRALLVWQRIILPDGSSVRIDNVPATDSAGYAGLADKVDLHTWQLLKGVALSSLLGIGTQLSTGSSESDLVRAIREATQQGMSRAGDQVVSRALNIQPTITVRPGWPLRVMVHKDIVLRPWRGTGS